MSAAPARPRPGGAGVGHVPQLEAPAATARLITEWFRGAAEAATPGRGPQLP